MTVKQPEAKQELLLLYDGHCNLCNWAVAYVYRNDRRKRIQIQSLQSYELPLPEGVNLVEGIPDSVLFYANGRWYDQSAAVLELMRALGGVHRFFLLGYGIPARLRNAVYRWVSRNRYRWFGRRDRC